MSTINDLTTEQINELLELSKKLNEREERADHNDRPELPEELYQEMEHSSSAELKGKLKKFAKDTIKYDGGKWTRSGAVNKLFLPELRKYNVDASQTVAAIYKGADRLRTAARSATEIYNDLQYIIEEGGQEEDMRQILEKVRRLAVYGFATGKELDGDAKDLTTRALRLPSSLKYLEDEEDDEKDLAFSPNLVEKIQQARYEESILRNATNKAFGGYGSKSGGFRGTGYRHGTSRGKSFFGRGRGRGPPTQTFSKDNNHSTTTNHHDNL